MLPKIESLPRSQQQLSVGHGNGFGGVRYCRSNVGGHVIWPFTYVQIRAIFRSKTRHKFFEIVTHIRIGILLNYQTCRSVTHKNMAKTHVNPCTFYKVLNFSRNIQKVVGFGFKDESFLHLTHFFSSNHVSDVHTKCTHRIHAQNVHPQRSYAKPSLRPQQSQCQSPTFHV